jgi:hypothetical protein
VRGLRVYEAYGGNYAVFYFAGNFIIIIIYDVITSRKRKALHLSLLRLLTKLNQLLTKLTWCITYHYSGCSSCFATYIMHVISPPLLISDMPASFWVMYELS